MPTLLTFYDFTFRARHALPGRSASAAHPHWHTYAVRLWLTGSPDQDRLSETLERQFARLHGADLSIELGESTDESLACYFLAAAKNCVRVRVTNDGRRGAEAKR